MGAKCEVKKTFGKELEVRSQIFLGVSVSGDLISLYRSAKHLRVSISVSLDLEEVGSVPGSVCHLPD